MSFRLKMILVAVIIAISIIGPAITLIPTTEWLESNILPYVFTMAGFNPTVAKTGDDGEKAVADGTFIQWWLVVNWDDDRWSKEFAALKEAGMHYIVLTPTAVFQEDKNGGGGANMTIYPTSAPLFETMKQPDGSAYPDAVDLCLRNARKYGFKVFLGLNFSDQWWSSQYSKDWLVARMNEGDALAADLWNKYHEKYANTFYGWYWCWEVNNSYIRNMNLMNSKESLADALKIQTKFLDDSGMRLPIMFSPYMNRWLGTPQAYAEMWKYVFANSGLRSGDIFCPQDSVGAGGLDLSDLPEWFSELRKSVETLPGLQFWSDTETFDVANWTAEPISRFIQQMQAVRPFVDNIVTFSYSHYYSPNIANKGFQRTYLDYVYAGMIDTIVPTIPVGLQVAPVTGCTASLTWKASTDNIGVCGYYVYRNGTMIANLQVPRSDTSGIRPETPTSMVDDQPSEKGKSYIYEVEAYDFAGNTSLPAGPVTITVR